MKQDSEVEVRGNMNAGAHLRAVLDTVIDGIITIDASGVIQTINPAVVRIFGYTDKELVGQNVKVLMPDPYAHAHDGYLHNYLSTGNKKIIGIGREVTGKRKDGSTFPMDLAVSEMAVHGERMFTGIVRDITERKIAENELADRDIEQQRFKNIVDQSLDGIFLFRPDTLRFVYVNRGASIQTGCSNEELLQLTPLDIKPEFTEEKFREILQPLLDGKEPSVLFETLHRHKDGHSIPVEIFLQLACLQGHEPQFLAVVRNITERQQVDHELRDVSLRLSLALSSARLGIWDLDVKNNVLIWDEYMYELYGASPSNTVLTFESWRQCIHPEDLPKADAAMNYALKHSSRLYAEFRVLLPNGDERYLRAFGKVIRDEQGQASRIVGVNYNFTDQMRAATRLQTAKDEANQANRAKSLFLAKMSHEIRTPMNGVIGMLDVLQQSSLRSDQVEMAELIRESALSLLGIIEDVLDFSKIEAGKLEVEKAPIPLANVVESVCNLLDHLAEKKGVELTLFTDPAIPAEVLGDALRLRQVLMNIANNAIKFSNSREQQGQVSVRAVLTKSSPEQVTVEFRIADNGIGMDKATRSTLFTPFTQADESTSRRFGGTGLGLAIAHHLVGLMGGEIAVQSELGEGATFIVRLPFNPLPAKPEGRGDTRKLEGLSCLVIGRPEGICGDLAAYLASSGAEVEQAPDLVAARERTRACLREQWIWVIDVGNESPSPEALSAAADIGSGKDTRFVIIGRGQRRRPPRVVGERVTVDGNVLTCRTVLDAVALAAGLIDDGIQASAPISHSVKVKPPTREEALRQGRLILVAEDNLINQKLITQQLALLGYTADIAGDGRQALDYWESGDYALLLTDLHMPEMDGYDLSLAIRSGEVGKRRIPIIALTANALKGEVKRCRAVGMDDYLSKPATREDLNTMLEKWLPNAAARLTVPDSPLATQTAEKGPVDVKVLEALVGNDPAVIHGFLRDFRTSSATTAEELKLACQALQVTQAGMLAHKLKSSAFSVGALALGELCAEIEQAGKAGQVEALTALLSRFEAETLAVNDYLDSIQA